jgi:hypothetical protein
VLVAAAVALDAQEAVDGFILRPLRFERYSLVKDVALYAASG